LSKYYLPYTAKCGEPGRLRISQLPLYCRN
jgi:hypothetical protein